MNSLRRHIEDILLNSDMDLSLSAVDRGVPSRWVIRSKASPVRIGFGLLFGIPCLALLQHTWNGGAFAALAALIFCPPLAILAVLFGLAWQQRIFEPGRGTVTRSFGVLGLQKSSVVDLPRNGSLVRYRTFSAFDSGGCYFYHVEVAGTPGLGFSIARQERAMDSFAEELARFLRYDIRDEGDRPERR